MPEKPKGKYAADQPANIMRLVQLELNFNEMLHSTWPVCVCILGLEDHFCYHSNSLATQITSQEEETLINLIRHIQDLVIWAVKAFYGP